jgi:proline iminopeptidase
MKRILFLLSMISLLGCKQVNESYGDSNVPADSIKTGGSRLIEIAGGHKVWTKKIGNGKIKVLLLHGGPGFSHEYMECFEDFLPKEGIEMYYYDQLGSGNSDAPKDSSLYNIPRFVEEVEQVRKGLGLKNFYLIGHSWGGMLTLEYLAKYQQNVKGAVVSNMTAGMKDYVSYTAKLKKKYFTARDIVVFDSLDRSSQFSSPLYSQLLMEKLYTKVICRLPLDKWPEPLTRAFKKVNQSVYIHMQGVDEFHVTGNFKKWEFWNKLSSIKIPVLVLGGKHDEMDPESLIREGRLLPNSRTYLCPDGSHMAMYDDQKAYFKNMLSFLKDVQNGSFHPDKTHM